MTRALLKDENHLLHFGFSSMFAGVAYGETNGSCSLQESKSYWYCCMWCVRVYDLNAIEMNMFAMSDVKQRYTEPATADGC